MDGGRYGHHEAVAVPLQDVDLGDPAAAVPVAYEMQDDRDRCRQLAVQRGAVQTRGRSEGLQARGDVGRGIGMDRAFSELVRP